MNEGMPRGQKSNYDFVKFSALDISLKAHKSCQARLNKATCPMLNLNPFTTLAITTVLTSVKHKNILAHSKDCQR